MEDGGKFRKKKTNFSMVSNSIIRDKTITLKAKGLYALIQSYITLDNFTLYKSFLMDMCCEGKKAFDNSWKELKETGYLIQYRMQDPETKQFYWEYELTDEPQLEPYTPVGYDGSGMVWKRDMMAKGCDGNGGDINNTLKNNILNSNTNPIISSADVMDMIGYDAFPVEDKTWLDEIVMLITEVFGMRDDKPVRISRDYISAASVKERYNKLNMGHIRYVLDSLRQNAGEIGNTKNYLLTTLYNAPTTMNTYYQNQIHNGY